MIINKYLLVCFTFFYLIGNSQNKPAERDLPLDPMSLDDMLNKGEQLLSRENGIKSRENKFYARFNEFWGARAFKNGQKNASFKYVQELSLKLLNNSKAIDNGVQCNSNGINSPNWEFIGPQESIAQDLGIIISLEVDPNDVSNNTVYAGTNASGLWKTTNALSPNPTWVNITDSSNIPGLGIQDILVTPNNTNIIYIATGISTYGRSYGVGILKTIDGGASWNIVYGKEPKEKFIIDKLIMDPNDNNVIYAAAQHKILRTLDAGTTPWREIYTLPQQIWRNHIRDIEFDLSDLTYNTLYFTTNAYGGAKSTFFKLLQAKSNNPTLDSSVTQPSDYDAPMYKIATTPAAPDKIFLMDKTVYVSSDGGVSWKNAAYPNPGPTTDGFGYFMHEFQVSKRDANIFYVGGRVAKKCDPSLINGFHMITGYDKGYNDKPHADVRAIALLNLEDEDGVFIGTDGGISYSSKSGANWKNINGKGLQITQFYHLAGAERYPNLILGGSQDNGVKKIDNNDWGNWVGNVMADGGECLINGDDPDKYYYMGNNILYSSPTASMSFKPNSPWAFEGAHMTFHGKDYNAISFSFKNIYTTNNNGQTQWTKQTNYSGEPRIACIAVSSSNPSTKYYALEKRTGNNNPIGSLGIIWKTTDGGQTWKDKTSGFEGVQYSYISDIEINPNNEDEIYIACNEFWDKPGNWPEDENWLHGKNRVFHSTDGGETYEGEAFSEGLPCFPVNKIAYQNGAEILYAATDVGVYYKKLNVPNATWVRWCDNLPQCIVTDLEINYCTAKLRIATFGKGLWQSDLVSPTNYSTNTVSNNTIWNDQNVYGNLRVANNVTLTLAGETRITPSSFNLTVDNGSTLNINNNAIFKYCQCATPNFNISGILNVSSDQFNLNNNAILNISSTGVVNINNSEGLCINLNAQVNIATGGKLFINGQDYTNSITSYNNFDKYFNNETITGNHYAFNNIESTGNVNSQNSTRLRAGRRIILKPGFNGKVGFNASIDGLINNCEIMMPCIEEKTTLGLTPIPSSNNALNIQNSLSREEFDKHSKIKIYPNPNNGQFTIDLGEKPQGELIEVYNVLGKQVLIQTLTSTTSRIDISNQPNGVYLVKIITGKEFLIKKILRQ